jgi:hypothetical protein
MNECAVYLYKNVKYNSHDVLSLNFVSLVESEYESNIFFLIEIRIQQTRTDTDPKHWQSKY